MRALLIEDHEFVRRGIKLTLAEAFPEASFAESATFQEAAELLAREPWDLILLDLNLPGRSGFDILAEAKKLHSGVPVLVVSSYPEEELAVRAIKLGAAGYLTKSSAADELSVAVKKVLAGGRYVSAVLAERLAQALGGDATQLPHESLSTRELQVLQLIASAKTVKDIAAQLYLSEKTIATYRARISEKLNLSSNVDLTRYAIRHRLVDQP